MCFFFFFFKHKTADEMRISDWSSDVCSSDLFPAERLWPTRSFCRRRQNDPPPGHEPWRRQFSPCRRPARSCARWYSPAIPAVRARSEEHTSELQSLMRNSYAVFCLEKKIHHLITELQNTQQSNRNI